MEGTYLIEEEKLHNKIKLTQKCLHISSSTFVKDTKISPFFFVVVDDADLRKRIDEKRNKQTE